MFEPRAQECAHLCRGGWNNRKAHSSIVNNGTSGMTFTMKPKRHLEFEKHGLVAVVRMSKHAIQAAQY